MSAPITLPARLDMLAAIALRDDLLAAKGDIALDASGVSMIGTNAVQVLMAAKAHFETLDQGFTVSHPTSDALGCLSDFGITPEMIGAEVAP